MEASELFTMYDENSHAKSFKMWKRFIAAVGSISIPLIYNAIGPNWLYGFRTRKTLSNPEIWYKANKSMAKELVAAGIVIIMLAIIAIAVHLRITMFTAIQATALFILVLLFRL